MKVKKTGFADGLDVSIREREKSRITLISNGLSNWKMEGATFYMEKIVETEICKDSSGFNFGQVQFVMVIKYPSEGVK